MADPTMGATGSDDTGDSDTLYTITIAAMSDGTFNVSMSDSDSPAEGGDDSGEDEASAQTANSADEVCQIVEQMISEESSESDQGDDSGGQGDDQAMPPDQATAYWKQLASKKAKKQGM